MRNIKLLLTVILLAFFSSWSLSIAQAQNTSDDVKAEIIEIVSQMPAQDTTLADKLAEKLVKLNPESTIILAQMLRPETEVNNNSALYGISAMTNFVGRDIQSHECLKHEASLLYALTIIPDNNNKVFLISQLQFIGSDRSIEPLSALLNDEYLKDHAARAISTISGKQIAKPAQHAPKGFISLFNDKDLTGWKMHDGLPGDNNQPKGKWYVENGAIVGIQDPPGGGGFLTTNEIYRDFELVMETKIDWPFDSGVFLRVGPHGKSHQVTLDYRDGGEIGGIYCPWTQNFVHHCPEGVNHFQKDQWNKLRITCTGEPAHIKVWVNDKLITDFQHTEATTKNIPAEGTICLQVHPGGAGYEKSKACFKNIYIRKLDTAAALNVLTAEEKAQGFLQLFNGTDLTGWVGSTDSYGVKDGVLFCRKDTGRNVYTEKEYDNFHLKFEFKLEPGSNNGLGIRAPLEGDAAYVGMELQILDNTAAKYSNLKDWQYHGSIYGIYPAKRGFLKPVGQWNRQEVIANGTDIKVILNGTTIVDANLKEAVKDGIISGTEHPGLFNKSGHIGFLGHGDYVEFRNIRILPLK